MIMLIACLGLAQAADPEFAGTDKEIAEAEEAEADLAAELGGSWTTGNTDTYTLSAGITGSYEWNRNKLGLVAGTLLGKSRVDANADGILAEDERELDRVETARKYFADARYDRFVSERTSLYLLAGALVDPFAGYDLRSHEQLGVSYAIIDAEDTSLLGELGVDYAQENFVEGADPDYQDVVAARIMIGLHHAFNENVAFDDTLEVYENVLDFEDLRVLNQASVAAKLTDAFSLKLGHSLTFDNQPVVIMVEDEGVPLRKLDQTTTVTFVASIF